MVVGLTFCVVKLNLEPAYGHCQVIFVGNIGRWSIDWQKMRLSSKVVPFFLELTKLPLVDDMVIPICHSVAIKACSYILVPYDRRFTPLIGRAKCATSAHVVNMPVREDHRIKGIARPRLNGVDTLCAAMLIRCVKGHQSIICFEHNGMRKGLNHSHL